MSVQAIIVAIIILAAAAYGVRILLRKRHAFKPGCGDDCGCHK